MSVSQSWARALCLCCLPMATITGADDKAGKVALKKWEEGVATFVELRKEQDAILVRSLEALEQDSEQAGDTALQMEARSERENLIAHGWLPTLVNTTAYEKKLSLAQKTLTQTAQRTMAALSRAKQGDDAAKVDKELAGIIAKKPITDPTPVRLVPWRDSRVAWGTKLNRHVYRLLKSGEWRESLDDPQMTVYNWSEVNRTPQYIELHDADRNYHIRLTASEAFVDNAYNPAKGARHVKWNDGRWIDPIKEKLDAP